VTEKEIETKMGKHIAEFLDINNEAESVALWDTIVFNSNEGWLWATRATHEFRVSCLKSANRLVADRSFMLVLDGETIGLAPLVIEKCDQTGYLTAAYLGVPLPWPMVVAGREDKGEAQRLIFDEIERRLCEAGVSRLQLLLSPGKPLSNHREEFASLVRARGFVDVSYQSHEIDVDMHTLALVRERYRRNVRKAQKKFETKVWCADDLPPSIVETYMALHIKDAGRVSRSVDTYERQIDIVRRKEAFFVVTRHTATGQIVGMLLVGLYKGAAYDSSVAVDPEFEAEHISHLMKWTAIEYLAGVGVKHYELGNESVTPTYLDQPEEKNYGISFFKNGWARGRLKSVFVAEKFYSAAAFETFWKAKSEQALKYLQLR
jgi:hypothetical protein